MARVLIVDDGARLAEAETALVDAGYAVRSVCPHLAGDVVAQLENVTVVAWLMAAAEDPAANDEMLETVLLKVVDTGVRGFVFESPGGQPNRHIVHAMRTWHLPVAELADGDEFAAALTTAVNRSIGL
jgi:hypothetical protein